MTRWLFLVALVALVPAGGEAASAGKPASSAFQQEQRMSIPERMRRWEKLLAQAAARFSVPQKWLRAVMLAESGGRTRQAENQPIRSRMGAMGLMQLMPETYAEMRAQYLFGPNPFDPHDNIFAAAAYLRWLHG